jgi:CRISPR-associated endonuclease Csn1
LNTLLKELPDSPAWVADAELRDGQKDRADHRHHAIDAVVVALTDQSRLHHLSRINRQGGTNFTGEVLPEPWPQFRESVKKAVAGIHVSHRVQRRVSGGLHEDTYYGPVHEKQLDGSIVQRPGEFVVRKPIESLTSSMIEDIRDPTIRQIVIARLNERGVPFGRGVKGGIPKEVWRPQLAMASGVPIRKARTVKRDETIQPIRGGSVYVKPGSTHHLAIFELTLKGKKTRVPKFVTMLEAIDRIRRGQNIIQRTHPDYPDAKFVMSLSQREMLILRIDGRDMLYRFDTAASTTKQMAFYPDNAAEQHGKLTKYPDSLAKLNPRKVTVDPLGRIRWAND